MLWELFYLFVGIKIRGIMKREISDLNVVNNGLLKHNNNGIWKYISKWTFIVKNNQRKGVWEPYLGLGLA